MGTLFRREPPRRPWWGAVIEHLDVAGAIFAAVIAIGMYATAWFWRH